MEVIWFWIIQGNIGSTLSCLLHLKKAIVAVVAIAFLIINNQQALEADKLTFDEDFTQATKWAAKVSICSFSGSKC